jgi:uncharacterized protein YdcH (DUF465 family)
MAHIPPEQALARDLPGQEDEIRAFEAQNPAFAALVRRYADLERQRAALLDEISNALIEAEETMDDARTL